MLSATRSRKAASPSASTSHMRRVFWRSPRAPWSRKTFITASLKGTTWRGKGLEVRVRERGELGRAGAGRVDERESGLSEANEHTPHPFHPQP